MTPSTVLLCMGTRPEIIKMAPVYHALCESPVRPVVLHTGQHGAVAGPLYDLFGMAPDHVLDLSRERPTLGHLNAQLLDAVDGVLMEENAKAVLVHGDTSTALSAAMAAFYAKAPIGHVEAGLRSGNPMNPFPEEMNRTVIARLAQWHFAPTQRAVRNLLREGSDPESVSLVGNTIVDAVHRTLDLLDQLDERGRYPEGMSEIAEWAEGSRLVLVTMHRRENWGEPIETTAAAVAEATRSHPDLRVLWPVHPNPDVRRAVEVGLERAGLSEEEAQRVRLTAPMDYLALLWSLRRSWLVLTDSGGIQEEAAAIGRPVLVLRRTTERPEMIEAGGGMLIGVSGTAVRAWLHDLATTPSAYDALCSAENPYGDGHAGERIAKTLTRDIGGPQPVARPEAPALPFLPTVFAPSAQWGMFASEVA